LAKCHLRLNINMDLEKIINDTRDTSDRLHAPEVLGPWEPCTLIADIAGESGTLAQSVLTIEAIVPAPPESAHLEKDIPRLLYILTNLSNVYGVDLVQAWDDLLREGWSNIAKLEQERK
jgi:hypothetical protein